MILYFDCYAGVSGDMILGALLDLGVPLEHLRTELDKLQLPPDSYKLSTSRVVRKGFTALKFDLLLHEEQTHRYYAGIDSLIVESTLSDSVKIKSRLIFRLIAEAEAKVHGVEIEKVHFHEVGAVDSIVDIVGIAICLDYLQIAQIYSSPLPMGSGFVQTAHGRLPVPTPATLELMKGLSLHGECGAGERVTPTGAAVIAALTNGCTKQPKMLLEKTGCGAGAKDFEDCPNILRAFMGRSSKQSQHRDVVVVESNIDDSTPEILGYAMDCLFKEGALDVWHTPIQMKKNRPAVMLSFISTPESFERLAHILLTETSAIGLRHYVAERIILERQIEVRQTKYGKVRFKLIFGSSGDILRSYPEYEDCRRIASESGIPYRVVMEHLQLEGNSKI